VPELASHAHLGTQNWTAPRADIGFASVYLPPVLRLALRSVRAHWRRFALTTIAVVVGVGFVVGSFVLTDSLSNSITRLLNESTGKISFVIRPSSSGGRGGLGALGGADIGGGGGGTSSGVPQSLASTVAAVPGVAQVDPSIARSAQLLGKAGQASDFDFSALSNWPAHPDMTSLRLVSGRAPTGPGDVVIDSATAADRGYHLGSPVKIATRKGVVEARIVGLAQRGSGDLGVAGSILAFSLPRSIELGGNDLGKVDSILVQVAPGADKTAVSDRITAAIGPNMAVLDADTLFADAKARIQDRLSSFNNLMLGFAAVTLFVSMFLIWNTFSMVVAQRRREIALLRAVGASGGQVAGSVVGEAAVVGLVASVLGILIGILLAMGLRALLSTFSFSLPSGGLQLQPRTIWAAFGVGLVVTLLSVIGPARRSTRVPPVALMQEASVPVPRAGRFAPIVGSLLIVIGLYFALHGMLTTTLTTGSRAKNIGLGAGCVVVGVTAISRFLTSPVVGFLGAPFRRLGGVASSLARRNAVRDPRRTAATAAALMIGLALVATTLVLGASVKTAFGGALRASITADVVVSADGVVPFDDASLGEIAGTHGVKRSVPLAFGRSSTGPATQGQVTASSLRNDRRNRIGVTVANIADIQQVTDPQFVTGGWPTADDQIAIAKSYADDNHLAVGRTIQLRNGTTVRPVTISGIYSRDEILDDSVASPATAAGITRDTPQTNLVMVQTTEPPTTAVLNDLKRATASIPNSTARTADGYVDSQTGALDIVLGIVDVLLLFAIGVAGIGVANTLALSVVERTRELGLLRVVGMHRRSMRRMVRVEGILVALFGGVLGLVLGIGFGSAIAVALPVDTAVLTFPSLRLVLLFVAAGVLGILAAAMPARRAARLDVLAAIAEN
jgi:putative ABC transport system permease protein